MPDLLIKPTAPDEEKCVLEITPQNAGWEYVGFAVHRLEPGDTLKRVMDGRETCIVVVAGTVRLEAGGRDFEGLGGRNSAFEDSPPGAAYIPPDTPFRITADTAAEIGLCTAPSKGNHPVRLIDAEDIGVDDRGEGTNRRRVRNILPETEPADSLLIAEVITPSGHWSSYPPHKHDTDDHPRESSLEETYYHRIDPAQGFVFQRVYTDDGSIDETMTACDGDVVMVPRGYHPVGVPHGYVSYYLNVMAGPRRTWIIHNDPAHEWILKDQ